MLAFDRHGGGPRPILLLHGFLGSGRNLSTLARQWAARDRGLSVLTVDLLGHGRSPPLPPGADLGTVADALLALCAAVFPDGGWVSLVGHSLGGRVALRTLERAPGRIAAVTLLDIGPGPVSGDGVTRRTVELLLAAPARFRDRAAARAFFLGGELSVALCDWLLMNLRSEPSGELGWRIDRGALGVFIEASSREDLWPVVAAFPERVRCLRGGASTYVDDDAVAGFARLGVEPVTTLAGAGHFLHVDAPIALLDTLAGAARATESGTGVG